MKAFLFRKTPSSPKQAVFFAVSTLPEYVQEISLLPITRARINRIMATAKMIFAMVAAAPAMPVKPKIPATSAITKKNSPHFNIIYLLNALLRTLRGGAQTFIINAA